MKPIPKNPNYGATKDGRIWSCRRKHFLQSMIRNGYKRVNLGRGKEYSVHRLILETYVGLCPKGMECRHLDGNRQNNSFKNLCWGTRSENRYDAVKHGTLHTGEQCNLSKLTKKIVIKIRGLYENTNKTQQEIANIYNISFSNVSAIANRKTWKII